MEKEEVTLQNKFQTLDVYFKNSGKKRLTTTERMTPTEALKHFNAEAVSGIIDE